MGLLDGKNIVITGVLTDAQGDIPAFPSPAEMEQSYASKIQALWNRYGFTSVLAITPSAAMPILRKVAAGGAVAAVVVVIVYLLGRRSGRKRSGRVEFRRF